MSIREFETWVANEDRDHLWIYRGQPARYSSLLPSQLRAPHRATYANRLQALDHGIAGRLLETLPFAVHDGVVAGPPGEDEGSAVHIAGDHAERSPSLTRAELLRGLAQHYGYPTMFVDLSLDPRVAAFFATHVQDAGRYRPSDEAGIVYRWPAVRSSETMVLLRRGDPAGDRYDLLPSIDLTRIFPGFARPRNQAAIMTSVAFRPFQREYRHDPAGAPVMDVPADQLIAFDLLLAPSCERFALPAGAGTEVGRRFKATQDALFPDRVDLGYSFSSVVALLSLVAFDPELWDGDPERGRDEFEALLLAGRTVLERECYRHAPGFPPRVREMTLQEAESHLRLAARRAREAARLPFGDVEGRRAILPDLEGWLERVTEVVRAARQAPVWAMADPVAHADTMDLFDCDPALREAVSRQLRAVEAWRSAASPFSGLSDRGAPT